MAKNVLSFNISPKSPNSTTLTEILANQPCHVPLCCHGRQLSHASCTVDRRQDMSLLVTHTAEHTCTVQMSLSHITSHHITPHYPHITSRSHSLTHSDCSLPNIFPSRPDTQEAAPQNPLSANTYNRGCFAQPV